MNACLTTSLMQQFHRLFWVLVLSLFSFQVMATETPVVVSVDHRVVANFSKPLVDGKKGVYTTEVRIKNRSAAPLLRPLRLTLEQFEGKDVKPLNAQGVGKDGQPYFEFALPKGMLSAGGVSEPVKVIFAIDKNKEIGAAKERVIIAKRLPVFTYHASAGVDLAPLEPRAEPYALTADSGKVNVRFGVRMVGKVKASDTVYLRRVGEGKGIAMNDQGMDGDVVAKDGVYGVTIPVDASKLKPDSCLNYEAFINFGKTEVVSSPYHLCMSAFPVWAADSNKSNPVVLQDGTKAVADEILFTAVQNTKSDVISRIAADINAKVVGSITTLNLYQLKLPTPVSAVRLLALVAQLKARPEVIAASVNALGTYAYTPNDPEYTSAPQHGLQRVRAQDVWDIGATGSGVTVIVMDSGLDRTHPDLVTPGVAVPTVDPNDCQLAENDCGGVNNDSLGHGTQVAGVIAAKTNTPTPRGVASVSYGSKLHSIQLSAVALISDTDMLNAFTAASTYMDSHGAASVINTSFSVLNGTYNWPAVCAAIDSAIQIGGVARAVVVNAVGNNGMNGNFYPARCKDLYSAVNHRADLLITVANSASVVDATCGSVPLDNRCANSNYGAWVDIAAPGSVIRTTAVGGGYSNPSGNSFSSPMVAGAVSILKQCGVSLDLIQSTLKTSGSNVHVAYPPGGATDWWPRLDIYRALQQFGAPTGVSVSTVNSVDENVNTASGYEVGTLNTTHAGTCNTFIYSSILGGADGGLFNIAGDKLRLNAGVMVNYEDPARPSHTYNLTVHVTDFFGTSNDFPLTVTVNNKNDAPTLASPGSVSYVDTAANDSFVNATGTLVGADEDVGDTLTYGVSGGTVAAGVSTLVGAYGTLAVNTTSGAYTFTPNNSAIQALKTNTSESYTVTVTDSVAPPVTATYTVNLTGANDPTNFSGDISASLSEDGTLNGSGTLAVSDRDSGDAAITPQVGTAGTYGVFSIANGGAWSYTLNNAAVNVQALDEGQNVADVFTVATAGGATQAITMTITGAKDPLTGSPSIYPAAPAAPAQRHVGDHLSAVTGAMTDADCPPPPLANNPGTSNGLCKTGACSLGYQWMASDTFAGAASAIPGTPGTINSTSDSTYTLRNSDFGKFMSLCVSTGTGSACTKQCSSNDAVDVGDPHITTVDALHYDFQSAGEFVALRGANGMEIQTRQTAVSTAPPFSDTYTGLTSGVSVNTAVAARVGKHRVTYQPDTSPNAAGGTFVLRVDGVPTTLPVDGVDLGDGGRVISQAGGIQIDFPDQTTLMINTSPWPFYGAWWLHVSVFHTSALEGIMGARSKGSWLPRLPNGSALGAMPAALHDRYVEQYVKFADSWRVNKETTLFDYAKDTSTETYTNKAWPTENGPYDTGNGPVAKPLGLKAAQLACGNVVGKNEKADCVFDVRVMGNAKIAQGHILTQKIRTGLTAIIVRDDRGISRDKEMVTFTATVARHAAPTRMELDRKVGAPTGTVQFTLNSNSVEKPVRLDARGQAQLKLPRLKIEKQMIGARYIPAKGSVFFPSSSFESARLMVEGKR